MVERFHRAAKTDRIGDFRARELPRVAESQPILGIFVLPAIFDGLAEQAVVVADAVAVGCDLQCRHALHEAGCEASEAAIAEGRVGLHLGELVEIDVETAKGIAELSGEAKIVQRVHEETPDQKF